MVVSAHLYPHALQIVQCINQALQIAAMAHLVGIGVMFVGSPVNVIVGGISIDKSVQEESVERKPPVSRRGSILVPGPLSPVVEGIDGSLVLIEIPLRISWVISVTEACCKEKKEKDAQVSSASCHCEGRKNNEGLSRSE